MVAKAGKQSIILNLIKLLF